jgi:hypothetical protein
MQKYLKIGYYLQNKITINMILSFPGFICLFSGYSQNDYPEPAKNTYPIILFNIVITIILTSMMQI